MRKTHERCESARKAVLTALALIEVRIDQLRRDTSAAARAHADCDTLLKTLDMFARAARADASARLLRLKKTADDDIKYAHDVWASQAVREQRVVCADSTGWHEGYGCSWLCAPSFALRSFLLDMNSISMAILHCVDGVITVRFRNGAGRALDWLDRTDIQVEAVARSNKSLKRAYMCGLGDGEFDVHVTNVHLATFWLQLRVREHFVWKYLVRVQQGRMQSLKCYHAGFMLDAFWSCADADSPPHKVTLEPKPKPAPHRCCCM